MAAHGLRTSSPALRPSDAERERALRALKAQYAEGRLSTEELEARIEDVYRSGTRTEMAVHLRGLPLRGVRWLIVSRARRIQRALLRMHLFTYATVNASLLGIWALTGEGIFWPAWFLLPSTALLAWHAVGSRKVTRALNRRHW